MPKGRASKNSFCSCAKFSCCLCTSQGIETNQFKTTTLPLVEIKEFWSHHLQQKQR